MQHLIFKMNTLNIQIQFGILEINVISKYQNPRVKDDFSFLQIASAKWITCVIFSLIYHTIDNTHKRDWQCA